MPNTDTPPDEAMQKAQKLLESTAERPYRSHSQPACVPCRRRKSRCQMEAGAKTCVTCHAHRTECYLPGAPQDQAVVDSSARRQRKSATRASSQGSTSTARTALPTSSPFRASNLTKANTSRMPLPGLPSINHQPAAPGQMVSSTAQEEEFSLALVSADDQHPNLHIVGPAGTNDSQVLSDYLSGIPGAARLTRMVTPESVRSRPVLFTEVQKRPVGISMNRSTSADRLETIEKLLEPYTEEIIDEYFKKVNVCLPLLDEVSFRRQFHDDKGRISPALLACLYAHTSVYWKYSKTLSRQRCPDSRFIWNLANEAVYSELHLSPGMSIITAILLNIGGRPTTSLIGNGVLLGSAISMAHSLGLNQNPLPWNIAQSEKHLRMKIWWALLIQDRWTSLAHGTPPLIARAQYDVPLPTIEHLCNEAATEAKMKTALVFIAFVGLTDVLEKHLQHVYHVRRDKNWNTTELELSLNAWVESLSGTNRLIIIRGSRLDIPGASNLRLAYLTTRLLLQRIELEADKQSTDPNESRLMNLYSKARRTAEEILILVQEFQPAHLGDFWLSISAFSFPATVNFLLRCALETENSPQGLAQSSSFRIARDLITTLRNHQEKYGWDLGDVCLAQHAEIVEKIGAGVAPIEQGESGSTVDISDFVMPDASILDQFLPSLWDPLQNAW